jgi:phosphate transport system substrate-binding protein
MSANTSGTGSTPSTGGTGTPPAGGMSSTPMRKRTRQFGMGATIGIAVVLLVVGIGGGYFLGSYLSKTSTATVDITETGSTLLEPMMDIWGPNYTSHVDSHVTLSPSGGGSGQGQSESEAGTIDIGASDAYTANNLGVVDVPVAISSQLVMYNLGSSFANVHLNLNATILGEIYEGTITTWNDPLIAGANPGVSLPSETIVPIVRSDSSGDTYIFSSYCDFGYSGWKYGNSTKAFQTLAPASGFQSGSGNVGVIDKLQSINYSIGYVGVSYKTSALSGGKIGYAALGDNLANTASGGTKPVNYVNWSIANVTSDASLGLNELNYASDGLAISLIMGGSPAGPTTWSTGGGGTNPTVAAPHPYPIVNLEYTLVKQKPSNPSHQAYVVQFLQWAISYGNNVTNYLGQVNFVPLTAQLQGLDQQALASVQISS